MTVETTSTFAGPYPLNGVATAFPFAFKALSASEVRVEIAGVEVAHSLFSVQLTGQGGTVVFGVAPTGGDLYVISAPDFRQVISFSNQSAFLPASHNEANDRAAIRAQVLADGVARAIQFPLGEDAPVLPSSVDRAGSALVFNEDGQPIVKPIGSFPPGPTGGNVMSIGLFTESSPLNMSGAPAGTNRVRTAGYSAAGKGGADYVFDATINAVNLGSYNGWAFLKAGGGGFKLSPDQPLDLAMLGWKTDHVSPSQRGTDNAPVLARLESFLSAVADARGSIYRYTPEIRVPLGRAYTTVRPNFHYATMGVVGVRQGVTDSDGLGGSVIVTAEGVGGITINSADTSGETNRPLSFGSTGSYVAGITMLSLGGQPGDAADGFRARGQVTFIDCIAIGYPRHGFNLSADLSGQGGNTNASFVMNCTAVRNYLDGFFCSGGDANAITIIAPNARYNGRSGINLNQFLANSLFGYHLEGNGTNDSGPRSMPQQRGALCYYQGFYYAVYPGRAADASNTTPGNDPNVWVRLGPGTPHPIYPTYVQGPAWSEGSAMRAVGANAQSFIGGGYTEPGEPPVFVGGGAMLIGGQQDAGVIGSQAYMYVSGGMLTAKAWQAFDGRGTTIVGGDFARQRLLYMRGPAGFEYEWSYDLTGGIFLRWAGQKTAMSHSVDANENVLTRIAFPILNTVRVPNATAPVATGAVSRTMPIYDETGAELGVIEIKARA